MDGQVNDETGYSSATLPPKADRRDRRKKELRFAVALIQDKISADRVTNLPVQIQRLQYNPFPGRAIMVKPLGLILADCLQAVKLIFPVCFIEDKKFTFSGFVKNLAAA